MVPHSGGTGSKGPEYRGGHGSPFNGHSAIARLNQLRQDADLALDNVSPPPLRVPPSKNQSKKSGRGGLLSGRRRLFLPLFAFAMALFGCLSIITSHGGHSSFLEQEQGKAKTISAWRDQAQQAITSYAENVKHRIPSVEIEFEGSEEDVVETGGQLQQGGGRASKEAEASTVDDEDEVRLDDIETGESENGEEEEEGIGQEGGGSPGSEGTSLDLSDVIKGVKDDGSCGVRLNCRPHGYCREGRCYCVAAFEGEECKDPKELPAGLTAKFEGNFVLNQRHVKQNKGIQIKTNPKAGHFRRGQTHTLFAPLIEEDREKYNRNFRHGRAKKIENQRKSVITPLLLKSMPELDFLNSTVFERCAIVGSSGLSKLYQGGEEIDAHNAVIRFNSAPTYIKPRKRRVRSRGGNTVRVVTTDPISYVEHVGRKTTFRFINTQHIRFFEGKEIRLQQMQSKNGLFRYLIYRKRYPHSRLYAFDTDFTSYVSSNIPVLPTGGYFAVLFAIQLCREVNMYGFHWQAGHAIAHHYFNNEVPVEGKEKIHDYDAEHANLMHIARSGLLNISQPCVPGCEAKTQIPCTTCPPGSTCGCGTNHPTPLSIPGFCHLKHNYTCYFKCPRASQCPGGPSSSRCPNGLLNYFMNKPCARPEDVPQKWQHPGSLKSHPKWMHAVYDM
ncbi:hypothetical protein HOP50_14g71320 [Chloropicon primus]|uniref:Sialyltransferase n=1 Tax=Chloropicon primus TaxID=1764295 RepID=A0A5B8MYX0_9CHLO|nr:hypothetical protein A3770_14p71120 [Chloropicon primus]UPR03802.1 hypothetical protein HOP50_14g71320 [Chloropicon primus]|eukprot:QDZ24594.1 hypothetical protein A3770_14p71120 [Chloropicon primus]